MESFTNTEHRHNRPQIIHFPLCYKHTHENPQIIARASLDLHLFKRQCVITPRARQKPHETSPVQLHGTTAETVGKDWDTCWGVPDTVSRLLINAWGYLRACVRYQMYARGFVSSVLVVFVCVCSQQRNLQEVGCFLSRCGIVRWFLGISMGRAHPDSRRRSRTLNRGSYFSQWTVELRVGVPSVR